jgi:HEAT repeat protein
MHRTTLLRALLLAALVCGIGLIRADEPAKAKAPPDVKDVLELIPNPDVEWLKRAKVPTDDAGMLRFLASCQGKEIPPAEIDALVAKLMSGPAAEQAEANRKLLDAGTIAVPALRRHRTVPDADAAKRVRECSDKIEEAGDKPLARPVMRRLLVRRPPGTAEALIGYLPFASDPAAEEDIYYGFDELVGKDPKALEPLAKALTDAQPSRRALAACILGRRGNPVQCAAVRELLKDPDANVRLRAAQGLLAGKDTTGLPTLIDLLTDASVEIRWQAEELLRWLAIEDAPKELAGPDDPKLQQACQNAWRQWWKANEKTLNLAEVEKEPRRPLLLFGFNRAEGKLYILGCDGVIRHEWNTSRKDIADGQYVPGGTIITLHEQPPGEKPLLAERDRAGKVLWQYEDMREPRHVQRLSNGQVFVAERREITNMRSDPLRYQELSATGRLLAKHAIRCEHVGEAFRATPEGAIICPYVHHYLGMSAFESIITFDPKTDTTKQIGLYPCQVHNWFGIEPSNDSGYWLSAVIPQNPIDSDPIDYYDFFGEKNRSYKLPGNTYACPLRGGSVIACAPERVVEITTDRRMIGEILMAPPPEVARPCLGLVRFGFDNRNADFDLEIDIDYRVSCLKKKDPRARLHALKRLTEFGPHACHTLLELKAFEGDPDANFVNALRQTQLKLGLQEIPRILKETKNPDEEKRWRAHVDLSKYNHLPEVIEAKLAALGDESARVRSRAAVFGGPGPDPQWRLLFQQPSRCLWAADRIVPALIKTLATDNDKDTRYAATQALGGFREKAGRAMPLLVSIVKDEKEHWHTRSTAITALMRIDTRSPEVVAAYYTALKSPVARLRGDASVGLGTVRPASDETLRRLREAIWNREDEDPPRGRVGGPVGAGLGGLRLLEANDKETLDHYMKILNDEEQAFAVRSHVAQTLYKLGKYGPAIEFMKKQQTAAATTEDRQYAKYWLTQFQRELSRARWKEE